MASRPTTMQVIQTVLITALTMIIGRYITDMTTIALNVYMPQTNKNKILFNICLILIFLFIVVIISFLI